MTNGDIGGYTLEQLLGARPVTQIEKKRSKVGALLALPFTVVAAIVKLPVVLVAKLATGLVSGVGEIIKLPVRVLGALFKPFRRS